MAPSHFLECPERWNRSQSLPAAMAGGAFREMMHSKVTGNVFQSEKEYVIIKD